MAPSGVFPSTYPNAFLTPSLDFVARVACCVGFKAATPILRDVVFEKCTYLKSSCYIFGRFWSSFCGCFAPSVFVAVCPFLCLPLRMCVHARMVRACLSLRVTVLLVCATACACLRTWSLSCLLVYFLACSLACLLACFLAGGRARNSCVPSCLTHSHACSHVSPITYVRTWFLAQSCM